MHYALHYPGSDFVVRQVLFPIKGFDSVEPSMHDQELEEVNLKIMQGVAAGRLDSSPFIQGILVACLRVAEKQERGVLSLRGKKPASTETESRLVEEAAFSFAVAGGNRELAAKLGQTMRARHVDLDQLHTHGLPNPMLAMMKAEQMDRNLELIDQRFARSPDAPARCLIMAVDHTYLIRTLVQEKWDGVPGLVGSPWSPLKEHNAFMDLRALPEGATKKEKASMMLCCLLWNPCSVHRETYSLSSMPMSLARCKNADETQIYSGNVAA